jgi:hypothetical protein
LFNYAIEEGLVEANPAARLGRFTRSAKTSETKGTALTTTEVKQFLKSAQEVCPDYHPLFLWQCVLGCAAGNSWAQWGDVQLAGDENDSERFILVQHNFVRLSTQQRKARRRDKWICRANCEDLLQVVEGFGGGGRTRTYDLRIMRPSL